MKPLGWREVIAQAGGEDAAMLYGAPLRSLLRELEESDNAVREITGRCALAASAVVRAGERAASSDALLAIERAAVARYAALVDPALARAVACERVVAAARDMDAKSVVSRRMAEALQALAATVIQEGTR